MAETRRYPYVLLDVFTHNPLEGNQLAVFTDARGLSDAEMQGSAAGCCTAWAVWHGVLASETDGLIEQGLEIARPSFIQIRGRKTSDGATDIHVGGGVVEVAHGEFVLR
jgi:predicted PhzF superfamily epimerase YddE/YHI9